jgi:hypothetical protein
MNRVAVTGLVGLLVLGVGIGFAVNAQEVVGPQGDGTPKSPKQSDLVTVRGCLSGSTLTTAFEPRQFQLSSSRELRALLDKHSGHTEEITGRLKSGNPAGGTVIKEKRSSKGRVYIGVGTRSSAASEGVTLPVIEVRSVTHIENECGK